MHVVCGLPKTENNELIILHLQVPLVRKTPTV